MKNWLVNQVEYLKSKFEGKEFLFNLIKISAVVICLLFVLICRISVDKSSSALLAKNASAFGNEDLDIFYKKPIVIPQKNEINLEIFISATSAIAIDSDTFAVLYEQNADERRAMASTTKLMTALVTLREFSPTRVISIDKEDVAVGGSSMFLVSGESYILGDLIKGLLIPSGNDAALTMENEFKNYGKDLVEEMNSYAEALGLTNTHYVNTSGLDADDHYSSARDLAIIANYASKDYTIRNAVSVQETYVYSTDNSSSHYLKSTNELLGAVEGVNGMKTGYTQNAGQCLIVSAERNGHKIITVVLNSPNRFDETEKLIDWVFENYQW